MPFPEAPFPALSAVSLAFPARLVYDAPSFTKGSVFWLSFTAVVVCNFLSALDRLANLGTTSSEYQPVYIYET